MFISLDKSGLLPFKMSFISSIPSRIIILKKIITANIIIIILLCIVKWCIHSYLAPWCSGAILLIFLHSTVLDHSASFPLSPSASSTSVFSGCHDVFPSPHNMTEEHHLLFIVVCSVLLSLVSSRTPLFTLSSKLFQTTIIYSFFQAFPIVSFTFQDSLLYSTTGFILHFSTLFLTFMNVNYYIKMYRYMYCIICSIHFQKLIVLH